MDFMIYLHAYGIDYNQYSYSFYTILLPMNKKNILKWGATFTVLKVFEVEIKVLCQLSLIKKKIVCI